MIIAEVVTLLLYALSMVFLPQYFGPFRLYLVPPYRDLMIFFFSRSRFRFIRQICLESSGSRRSQLRSSIHYQSGQESSISSRVQ
jgi:hypothetical protein